MDRSAVSAPVRAHIAPGISAVERAIHRRMPDYDFAARGLRGTTGKNRLPGRARSHRKLHIVKTLRLAEIRQVRSIRKDRVECRTASVGLNSRAGKHAEKIIGVGAGVGN